jgi:restriction system protein
MPKRATIVITARGTDVLKKNPFETNVRFLRQFPEFVEFQNAKREDVVAAPEAEENSRSLLR